MRYSKLFGRTVKTIPSNIKASSHKLLYKGGFIRQVSAGRYAFLPLGFRVWEKIFQIVDEEVKLIGVDDSEPMLEKARDNLAKAGCLDRCELIEADLNAGLEIENASVVLMLWTLQFIRPLTGIPY